LSHDDTLPLIVIVALSCIGFEDRPALFLELEDQGMIFLVDKQSDEAAGADAANTHDLQGEVLQVVAIQQDTALIRQRLAIVDECLTNPFLEARDTDVVEQRRERPGGVAPPLRRQSLERGFRQHAGGLFLPVARGSF
jgi:hypothetical protein